MGNLVSSAIEETLETLLSSGFPMEKLKESYDTVRNAPFPDVLKTETSHHHVQGVMAFGSTAADAREMLLQFQTHGNEPAWVALYDVLAGLEKNGLLNKEFRTILSLGNAPAADLYWQHWENPETRSQVRERVAYRKVPGSSYQMNRIPYGEPLSNFLDGPSPELDRAARLEQEVYLRPNLAAVFDGHSLSVPAAHAFAVTLNGPSEAQWRMLAHSGVSKIVSNIDLGGDGILGRMGNPDKATPLIIELGQHEDPMSASRVPAIALQLLSYVGALTPEAKAALDVLVERQPERFGGKLEDRVIEEYKIRRGEGAGFSFPDKGGYYVLVPSHMTRDELDQLLPRRDAGEDDIAFTRRMADFIQANPEMDSPLLNMQYLKKGDAIAFELDKRNIVPSPTDGHICLAPRNRLFHDFDEVLLFYMDGPFERKLGEAKQQAAAADGILPTLTQAQQPLLAK